MCATKYVSHIAAYKARMAGAIGPVYLVGDGARHPYWQCETKHGAYNFRV